MRFFEKFGVRVEERGGGIETPDEVAGYGEDEISGGASPYTSRSIITLLKII